MSIGGNLPEIKLNFLRCHDAECEFEDEFTSLLQHLSPRILQDLQRMLSDQNRTNQLFHLGQAVLQLRFNADEYTHHELLSEFDENHVIQAIGVSCHVLQIGFAAIYRALKKRNLKNFSMDFPGETHDFSSLNATNQIAILNMSRGIAEIFRQQNRQENLNMVLFLDEFHFKARGSLMAIIETFNLLASPGVHNKRQLFKQLKVLVDNVKAQQDLNIRQAPFYTSFMASLDDAEQLVKAYEASQRWFCFFNSACYKNKFAAKEQYEFLAKRLEQHAENLLAISSITSMTQDFSPDEFDALQVRRNQFLTKDARPSQAIKKPLNDLIAMNQRASHTLLSTL